MKKRGSANPAPVQHLGVGTLREQEKVTRQAVNLRRVTSVFLYINSAGRLPKAAGTISVWKVSVVQPSFSEGAFTASCAI